MSGTSFEVGGFKPIDRRYLRLAYQNGAQIADAKIAGGFSTITSTGVYGPYSINFAPVVFANSPSVVLSPGLSSGALFTVTSLSLVSATGVQFYLMAFNPGQVFVPAAQTVVVEWIAVGS